MTDSSSPAQQLLTRAADLVALEKQATEVDVSCTLYCSFFLLFYRVFFKTSDSGFPSPLCRFCIYMDDCA